MRPGVRFALLFAAGLVVVALVVLAVQAWRRQGRLAEWIGDAIAANDVLKERIKAREQVIAYLVLKSAKRDTLWRTTYRPRFDSAAAVIDTATVPEGCRSFVAIARTTVTECEARVADRDEIISEKSRTIFDRDTVIARQDSVVDWYAERDKPLGLGCSVGLASVAGQGTGFGGACGGNVRIRIPWPF